MSTVARRAMALAALLLSGCLHVQIPHWREVGRSNKGQFEIVTYEDRVGALIKDRSDLLFRGQVVEQNVIRSLLSPVRDDLIVYGKYGSTLIDCKTQFRRGCAGLFLFDGRTNQKHLLVSGEYLYYSAGADGRPVFDTWAPGGDVLALDHRYDLSLARVGEDGAKSMRGLVLGDPEARLRHIGFRGWGPAGRYLAAMLVTEIHPPHAHLVLIDTHEESWSYVASMLCENFVMPSCWTQSEFSWQTDDTGTTLTVTESARNAEGFVVLAEAPWQ